MMKFLLALSLVFLVPAASVFAQADASSFTIKVFGAEDTEAPTTPGPLTATPISSDQIDLAWGASNDNFVVAGYAIYRNGSALATTSQSSYSDVGLAASTTYQYIVRAFDPSFNYSSSSNQVSATTFAPPPVVVNDSQKSTATRVVLNDLRIQVGFSSSTFYINTARPARFEIRWGRTTSYELGYTVNQRFVSNYETTITDLEPGTVYEYEVIGYTPFNSATVLERGRFTTLSAKDFLPPANVNRFQAVASDDNVRLSWQLPIGQDLASVRIVRSHLGFPTNLRDGSIIYQGTGTSFTDEGVLRQYSPVYYTAFVIDASGKVSSGAVAKVYAGSDSSSPGPSVPRSGEKEGDQVVSVPPTDGFTPGAPLPEGAHMPELSDIFILQGNKSMSFADAAIELDSETAFSIAIPKEAVTADLKTIIVSFSDPTDSRMTSSFLLRINSANTAYEAIVAPLNLEGVSRVIVDVYDYKSAVVGTFQKTVTFSKIHNTVELPMFPDKIFMTLKEFGLYLGSLLLLLLLVIVYRRRRALEDNAS